MSVVVDAQRRRQPAELVAGLEPPHQAAPVQPRDHLVAVEEEQRALGRRRRLAQGEGCLDPAP